MATKKAIKKTHDKKLPASGLVSLTLLVPGHIKERLERRSLKTGQSIDQVASFFLDEKRVEALAELLIERELDRRYGHYEEFLENQAASAAHMRQVAERLLKTIGISVQKPKRKNSN